MDVPSKKGGARAGSGRKPLQPGVTAVAVVVKMTAAQKEKLQRLGGAPWVRDSIDRAREPTPKE
ncbi:hypothetical protein [Rhizobacter sp. SG703]|uniref:hypothetical protein n=1 Tax=Rhizobacter sp. SG703 TaxID=2587140 RepID=UPI0014471D5F|nr:hypothetical protein [Rhizobacter sp. SG703]NKI96618.1 hypothetical protein [Rhizobacter sp. SG703]